MEENTMPLAIQEHLLPGRNMHEQLAQARALGFSGIEVRADGLEARLPELAEALVANDMQVAAVYVGQPAGYLSPRLAEREAALGRLRQALAAAVDLQAPHVVCVPHFGPTQMPDLTPYRSASELEGEMMLWLLRTVSDLAYALGVELNMLPVNPYESQFFNYLEQAAIFRTRIKEHPHVRVAVNLRHLALTEPAWLSALKTHLHHISYIQLAEPNRMLPGEGLLDYAALAEVLAQGNYRGWLTVALDLDHAEQRVPTWARMPACLDHLQVLHRTIPK
jgi:sugar phosphate isomerase/epimerase